jgi:GT2 family glycosyltransferase
MTLTAGQSHVDPGASTGAVSSSRPEVSVVIVSWNTRDLLRDCLKSVIEHSGKVSLEIIVSDNDSGDGSQEMVREEFPGVILVENGRNLGFAAANNVGMRCATGRDVLLLNPDALVLDGAVEKSLGYLRAHPRVGIVGCRVLENLETVQRTCFSFPTPWNTFLTEFGLAGLFPRSGFFNSADLGSWNRDTEREVEVVSGMFMLVRREVLNQIGLMDEAYFVYAEEADLCFRAWKAGWTCIFWPGAQIIHRDGGGKATGQVSVKMYVQLQKSLSIFQRKNRGFLAYVMLKLVYVMSIGLRLPAYLMVSVLKPSPKWKGRAAASWAALKFHLFGVDPTKATVAAPATAKTAASVAPD